MCVGYALYSFFPAHTPSLYYLLLSNGTLPLLSYLDKICQLEKEKTARSSSQPESSSAAVGNLSPLSQDTRMDLVLDLSQQVECMRCTSGSALCVLSGRMHSTVCARVQFG